LIVSLPKAAGVLVVILPRGTVDHFPTIKSISSFGSYDPKRGLLDGYNAIHCIASSFLSLVVDRVSTLVDLMDELWAVPTFGRSRQWGGASALPSNVQP